MFLKRQSVVLTLAGAVAALLFAVVPTEADPPGGYSAGRGMSNGYSGGRDWDGGRGINNGYSGGRDWDGGRGIGNGYSGGRDWDGGRGWSGGYYPGNYGNSIYWGGSRFSIGIGTYPSYNYGYSSGYARPYYAAPSTTIIVQPNDGNMTQAGYAQPAAPDNRSRVEVRVPNDSAQLLFDGAPTQQTGTERVFVSPPLNPGQNYRYSVEAKWMENGKAMDQTRTVTVTPNQTAVVDFNNNR